MVVWVCFWVGNVWVYYYDGEEMFVRVEDLYVEVGGVFGDEWVEDGFGGCFVVVEGYFDVYGWVEFGEDVGDNVELVDMLGDDFVVYGVLFVFGKVVVDGFVYVIWVYVSESWW